MSSLTDQTAEVTSDGRAFDLDPGEYSKTPQRHESSGLWFYGNVNLMRAKRAYVQGASGPPYQTRDELREIERQAECLVLDGNTLVCGCHNPAQQRAAIVPLRWGAPRIVVVSGGIQFHLGSELKDELFRTARLWRYEWDPSTDLIVSRRSPDKKPTFALHNPTVDRLIARLASDNWCNVRKPKRP